MTDAKTQLPFIYRPSSINIKETTNDSVTIFNENFQSKLSKDEHIYFKDNFKIKLGEPHPFDYSIIEQLEEKFGLITAIEDKIADYTLGPGMFIDSEDQKLKDFLEDWAENSHLKFFVRPWFRSALGKGTGYLEVAGLDDIETNEKIKVIDTNTMYIKRDETGTIEKYNQFIGSDIKKLDDDDIIPIIKENVIQLNINQIGNKVYGNGIVFAGISIIDSFLNASGAMHKLLRRKANSPLHAKLGNADKDDYPDQIDIDNFGKKLQFMNSTTEWATGPNVEFKVLDFGSIGDKFLDILQFDLKLLSYAFQVPEAILGADKGFVGSSEIQDEGFNKLIRAYQEQIGFIIKTKIFDTLLLQNGFEGKKYKIVWGQQSIEEKNNLRESYQKILSSSTDISPGLKKEYERKLAEIDNIDFETVEAENVIAKKEMEQQMKQAQQNPALKPNNNFNKKPNENICNHNIDHIILDEYLKGKAPQEIENELMINHNVNESEVFNIVDEQLTDFENDVSLNEWIGEFVHVKKEILEVIQSDTFSDIAATKRGDLTLGKLNKKQVEQLRNIMSDAFENNRGLNDIAKNINKIGLKDRFIKKDGTLRLAISHEKRAFAIARSETVRLRANGSLVGFENKKIKEVTFTLVSAKPCPQCEALDGTKYPINEAFGIIPVHSRCRCKWEENANDSAA